MQLKKKSPSTALYVEGHGCMYVHAIEKKNKSKYSFVRRGATVCIKYTRVCASNRILNSIEF